MAFKTRRQARYDTLRKAGFLKFEARDLSRVPFNIPYMRPLIKQRADQYNKAVDDEWTIGQWEKAINKRYHDNQWLDSKGKPSAWALLRDFEHKYRAKYPQYDSPWQKRKSRMRNFIKFTEKKIAQLPQRPPMSEETRLRLEQQQHEMEEQFKYINERRQARENND